MSKAGKALLLFSGLFFAGLYSFRLVYGGWHDSMWVPLGLCLALFIGAVVKDFRALMGFFAMRTTKHGANMGVLILLVIAGLVCVNYLAVRYDKKADWTSEKLNSLSDQSVKAAQSLQIETEFVLLYRNEQQSGENLTSSIRTLIDMYRNVSPKVKFSPYNALQRPDLAAKFEYTHGPYVFYVVQGEKRITIEQPTEEGVTRAFLKLSHEKKKQIYFIAGHGERALDGTDEEGLSHLKEDLSTTYEVRALTLYESGNKVPDDAGAVVIVRPQQQFLEPELQALRDYARKGGRLLIAIEQGSHHNLAQLTKTFGVEFGNDFILDLRSQVIQAGPATVLGTVFSTGEITKSFLDKQFVLFHMVSSLKKAPDAASSLTFDELVKTDPQTMTIADIREQQVQFRPNGPHTIAIMVSGALPAERVTVPAPTKKGEKATDAPQPQPGSPDFAAVIIGDTDFLSNRLLHNNLNKDLILNSIASLMRDKDLISIRPKEPKGTKLNMSRQELMLYLVAFLVPLASALFLASGLVWWRRRTA